MIAKKPPEKKWVIVCRDEDNEDDPLPDQVFGPFNTLRDAKEWIPGMCLEYGDVAVMLTEYSSIKFFKVDADLFQEE